MNDYSTANMANPVVDYYRKHLPTRNRIRRYSPATILEIATYVLRTKADEGLGNKPTYLPWIIMLIIRWTYQYGDTAARREITEPEFNQIYNEIYSLGDGIRFEGQDTSNVFESFFRRTLFHQLPFQLSINDVGTGLFIRITEEIISICAVPAEIQRRRFKNCDKVG